MYGTISLCVSLSLFLSLPSTGSADWICKGSDSPDRPRRGPGFACACSAHAQGPQCRAALCLSCQAKWVACICDLSYHSLVCAIYFIIIIIISHYALDISALLRRHLHELSHICPLYLCTKSFKFDSIRLCLHEFLTYETSLSTKGSVGSTGSVEVSDVFKCRAADLFTALLDESVSSSYPLLRFLIALNDGWIPISWSRDMSSYYPSHLFLSFFLSFSLCTHAILASACIYSSRYQDWCKSRRSFLYVWWPGLGHYQGSCECLY